MNRLIAIALLVCFAGCSGTAGLPDDAYQAEADAVVALAFAVDPAPEGEGGGPAPSPDDSVGKRCPNYSGSGRCLSGDGNSVCGTCGGDGRIDPDDLLKPAAVKRMVTLHTDKATARQWPMQWYENEREALRAMNVAVVLKSEADGVGAWLMVCRGDVCLRFERYLTADEIRPLVQE